MLKYDFTSFQRANKGSKVIDRLRKKLSEQESLLLLTSPSMHLRLYNKSGKVKIFSILLPSMFSLFLAFASYHWCSSGLFFQTPPVHSIYCVISLANFFYSIIINSVIFSVALTHLYTSHLTDFVATCVLKLLSHELPVLTTDFCGVSELQLPHFIRL